jgi:CheY-like chemotaxis protein
LCRSIVELHGGSISAASAGLDQGSAFTVRLPVASDARVAAAIHARSAATDAGLRLRVLVVDDNRDSADSLTLLIQMKGHDARAAYHGNQAIATTRNFKPDLVLLDLAMPDIDGFALLRSLRELAPQRRVLHAAMTGFGQNTDRERTRAAGFDVHLVKPITMPVLDDLLAKAANAARLDGSHAVPRLDGRAE